MGMVRNENDLRAKGIFPVRVSGRVLCMSAQFLRR